MDKKTVNTKPDNKRLVEAMRQFKTVRTVIFQEEFYKAVVEALFYVPISIEGAGRDGKKQGKYCVMRSPGGQKFLCAFTSPEELEKCYGDRDDIAGVLHNFASVREVIINESNGLDGLVFDPKGENVAISKAEMMPKE